MEQEMLCCLLPMLAPTARRLEAWHASFAQEAYEAYSPCSRLYKRRALCFPKLGVELKPLRA